MTPDPLPFAPLARLEECLMYVYTIYGNAADERDTALMAALYPIVTQLSPRDVRRVRDQLATLDVDSLRRAADAMRECV